MSATDTLPFDSFQYLFLVKQKLKHKTEFSVDFLNKKDCLIKKKENVKV
jgi:hypothetical protein